MVNLLRKRLLALMFALLAGGLALAVACGGEEIVEKIVIQTVVVKEQVPGEKIVETVIVEKVLAGEKVVETVIVERPVTRIEKVIETVIVEKIVAGEKVKVVETVIVEKLVTRIEKVVETVIVEKIVAGEKVVETVIVEKVFVATPTPLAAEKASAPQGKIGTLTLVGLKGSVGKKAGTNGSQASLYRKGVTEGPFYLEPPKIIKGMVVETWEVSPDRTKITLNIRHGIQFHQGWGELTAEDVAWNIDDTNSSTNPNSIHAAAGDYAAMLGANPAVVVDEDTVELTVVSFDVRWSANQFNVAAQTAQMFSKKACDEMGLDWCNDNIIGTGPFEVVEFLDDDRFVLSAVEKHWRRTPQFSRYVVVEVPEEATRKAMMLTGEADLADVSISVQSELREKGFRVAFTNGVKGSAIHFPNYWETTNQQDGTPLTPWDTPPYEEDLPYTGAPSEWTLRYTDDNNPPGMDDMEQARLVRQALAMSYDRDLINEAIFDGLAIIHHIGGFQPFDPNFKEEWKVPFDPAQAEDLLDQAGFPRGSNGVRFEVTLSVRAGRTEFTEVADAMGGFWDKIGVKTTVAKVDYRAVFRPTLVARTNTSIYYSGCRWNNSLPWDWPRGLENTSLSRGGFNCSKEIPKITETFQMVNLESDRQKRMDLNTELGDYVRFWMIESGGFLAPWNIVYNPRSVVDWPMPDAVSPGRSMPERIIPVKR